MQYVVFSFKAKPGREKDLAALLDNAEAGRAVAHAMGASRNMLFLNEDGRMVRLLEFADGVKPLGLGAIAEKDPNVKVFLRRVAEVVENSFDPDRPETLDAFNRRNGFRLAFDVRV